MRSEWITAEEAAALADTHPNYLRQVAQRGGIQRKHDGARSYMYLKSDVIKWAKQHRGPKDPNAEWRQDDEAKVKTKPKVKSAKRPATGKEMMRAFHLRHCDHSLTDEESKWLAAYTAAHPVRTSVRTPPDVQAPIPPVVGVTTGPLVASGVYDADVVENVEAIVGADLVPSPPAENAPLTGQCPAPATKFVVRYCNGREMVECGSLEEALDFLSCAVEDGHADALAYEPVPYRLVPEVDESVE